MDRTLTIVLTACGCPGASTLIRELKKHGDVYIIGTDCDPEAIGRFLCDDFVLVPPVANEHNFINALEDLIDAYEPDVIFPQSSLEVPVFAKHQFNVPVLVSSSTAIETARNKYKLYEILRENDLDRLLPDYCLVHSWEAFRQWGKVKLATSGAFCFKPPVSKGSRGFRIVSERVDRVEQLLNQKPNARYTSMAEIESIFTGRKFPELLLMDYIEGQEVTADVLCLNGVALLTTVKTVEQARWGVIVRGELVNRPDIVEAARQILEIIPLSYCVNLQFIGGKLIEINPRVSSFIYQDEFCAPWLAIQLALGYDIPDYQDQVAIGRRMVRYMDQVFYDS